MSKNIKDVEFAFFSQLAYLNWNTINLNKLKNENSYINKEFINFLNLPEVWDKIRIDNLEPKLENGVLMYNEFDKRLFGVFGIKKNSQNPQLVDPLYDFNGWQFVYSADKTKLFKDKYNHKVDDDGFFACAFMKDNEIVVAYRGTEPDTIEDLLADLEIGFLNHNHSQLVCAYMFLEHIKSIYPNKNIHITGHSLGGCLAQYAYVCGNKQYPTVTWNALGLGKHKNQVTKNIFWGNDVTSYLQLYSLDIKRKLESSLFSKSGEISNDFFKLSEKQMTDLIFNKLYSPTKETIESGYYKVAEKEIGDLKVSVGTASIDRDKKPQKLNKSQDEELRKNLQISSIHIYWLLKGIKNYQLSFDKPSVNIKSFYNSLDWTALLQTREGKTIDVLTGTENLQEETNDTQWNIIKLSFNKFGFAYHSVNDFLLYMNVDGMVESGKYSEVFIKNLIKTLYLNISKADTNRAKEYKKLNFIKEGTINKTEESTPFVRFHTTCTKTQRFGDKNSEISLAQMKYELSAKNSLSSDISSYVPYRDYSSDERQIANDDEVGIFTIGQLTNVHLCSIIGGDPVQLIKIVEANEEKPKEKVEEPKKQPTFKIIKYSSALAEKRG